MIVPVTAPARPEALIAEAEQLCREHPFVGVDEMIVALEAGPPEGPPGLTRLDEAAMNAESRGAGTPRDRALVRAYWGDDDDG